jgi:hypothetical protein
VSRRWKGAYLRYCKPGRERTERTAEVAAGVSAVVTLPAAPRELVTYYKAAVTAVNRLRMAVTCGLSFSTVDIATFCRDAGRFMTKDVIVWVSIMCTQPLLRMYASTIVHAAHCGR